MSSLSAVQHLWQKLYVRKLTPCLACRLWRRYADAPAAVLLNGSQGHEPVPERTDLVTLAGSFGTSDLYALPLDGRIVLGAPKDEV